MPYVNLQITKGATQEQKVALVREFTDVLARVLGKRPEHTRRHPGDRRGGLGFRRAAD